MPHAKLLVIGLDAADRTLLLEWAADGSLPCLAQLLESGRFGEMRSPPGQYAGSIWPSIHTGCSPARHGRYFHTQLDSDTFRYRKFLPADLREAPFWARLSQAGKRVAIIDVPKAPVVAPFNGVQLLDWGAHDPEFDHARAFPSSYAREVEARFGKDPVGRCDRARRAGLDVLRDKLIQRIDTKRRILEDVLANGPWDLVMAVFAESHCAGHQFWHMHDPEHPKHDRELARSLGNPLKDVYRALDSAVGKVIANMEPDGNLILFSSHGMGAHYDGTFMLRDIVRKLQSRSGHRATPQVAALRWLWRRMPRSTRKRSLDAMSPIKRNADIADMKNHDFFAVATNDNCGGIRINLKGREPRGRISPGREYAQLCADLTRDLGAIVNLDTGEPLVRTVLRTDELFEGPCLGDLPDLNVVWNRRSPVRRIGSERIGVIERRYEGHRTGDHRSKGLFLLRGPSIGTGETASISAMDLAPSICAWLGVPLDADGSPVPGLAFSACPESGMGLPQTGADPETSTGQPSS